MKRVHGTKKQKVFGVWRVHGTKSRRCLVCGGKIELDELTNFVVSKLYFDVGYCRRNNENWTTG